MLRRLCLFSENLILKSINEINQNEFVSLYVETEIQLEIQINKTIESIRNLLVTQMNSFLNYIRIINQENYFLSALNTNAILFLDVRGLTPSYTISGVQTRVQLIGQSLPTKGCSTDRISTQAYLVSIGNETDSSKRVTWQEYLSNSTSINGFFVGCTTFDSILESTLDCLYEIDCLQYLIENFPTSNRLNLSKISDIVLFEGNQNFSINNLLNNLLINQWSIKVNYSNYFSKCNPSFCTYTRTNRIHLSESLTQVTFIESRFT